MPPRKSDGAKAKEMQVVIETPETAAEKDSAKAAAAAASITPAPTGEAGRASASAEPEKRGHPHSAKKDKEGINIEDLNLPRSIVTRLSKSHLPTGTSLAAPALLGIQKSATVFVSYLANQANEYALASQRKTVSPADVLRAVEECGFGEWKELLEEDLKAFMDIQKSKKKPKVVEKEGEDGDRPRKKVKGDGGVAAEETQGDGDEDEVEDGEEPDDEEDDDDDEDEEGEEEEDGRDDADENDDDDDRPTKVREDEALDNGEDSD